MLLQAALAEGGAPVWVRGGIGPNVAAGCVAAGAAGVVLDGALLLARESPLEPEWRERIARWDGSETTVVAPWSGAGIRVFAVARLGAPGSTAQRRQGGRHCPGKLPFAITSAGDRPVPARRSGRGAGGSAGPQVCDRRRDRAGRRASDLGMESRPRRPPGRWRNRRPWPSPMARAFRSFRAR